MNSSRRLEMNKNVFLTNQSLTLSYFPRKSTPAA
jgi:hypothetical protein